MYLKLRLSLIFQLFLERNFLYQPLTNFLTKLTGFSFIHNFYMCLAYNSIRNNNNDNNNNNNNNSAKERIIIISKGDKVDFAPFGSKLFLQQ